MGAFGEFGSPDLFSLSAWSADISAENIF